MAKSKRKNNNKPSSGAVQEKKTAEAAAEEAEKQKAPEKADKASADTKEKKTAQEEKSPEENAAPAKDEGSGEGEEDTSAKAMFAESLQGVVAFKNSAAKILNILGIPEMLLLRCIAAFFSISAVNIINIKYGDPSGYKLNPVQSWKEFVPQVKGAKTIIFMAGIFLILSFIYFALPKKFRITDHCASVLAVLYFDVALLWRAGDFYLSFGVMMVSVVFIYYSVCKLKSKKLFNSIPWWVCGIIVLAAASAVAAFVAITTVCCHKAFGTACHDFGLFVQMYHSLINDGTAITSCERDGFMSHFRIHASYIFYILVPFFKMAPKGETLLIAQAILSMGGIIPMFLIAKKHGYKGVSLIFMGFAYVFCIGIVAPCYYEFHENAFLPTILMWLIWAADRKNYVMFYIMSVITCIVKEDAPLYVISIALFLFFEDKGRARRFNCLLIAAVSGIYMVWITNWLTENGDGQMMMTSRFNILMIDNTGGLKEVVKNSLADPGYLFSLLVKEETVRFFLQVMVPFLFIPFFTKKISRFLLMIPFIVMNLVIGAGYGYAANVGFQYIFGPVCLLLYMCVINLDDMGQKGKQNIPVALGSAAMILTIGTCSQKWSNYENYHNAEDYFVSLDAMLDRIPKDAAVGTDTFLVSHLADHKEVYIFDSNDYYDDNTLLTPEKFDFVAIPVLSDIHDRSAEVLAANGYTLWDQCNGKIEVYISPNFTAAN